MTHRLNAPTKNVAVATATQNSSRLRTLRTYFFAVTLLIITWFIACSIVVAQTDTVATESKSKDQIATESTGFDFFGNEAPMNVEQLREMQEHFLALSKDVADATVSVQVGQSQGTGVIVTRDGYVMTAAHVISGANLDARILLPDKTELKAKTLGLNRTIDSGLLKIVEKGKYPYLNPGISENLKNGQWVMAIGHPGGWDADRGLVFRIGRILRHDEDSIQTDCSLVGGDSGGPLVDMNGEVIGIHSRIGPNASSNIHVPVDAFSNEWDKLASAEDWGNGIGGVNPANQPWLGIGGFEDGMTIKAVTPDGPADKAGLKSGDKILAMGDDKVTNIYLFQRVANKIKPGEKVTFKITRDDEAMEIEVTVGSRADE